MPLPWNMNSVYLMSSYKPFSKKQLQVLTWWCTPKTAHHDAVICDGAVRSGKTLCMSVSFVTWSFRCFNGGTFALCGKTVTSLRRNLVVPLLAVLGELGFVCEEKLSKNYIDLHYQGRSNRFYLFGGKDESSASLIQGITLAGVLFDEVALMPRSFVEQALARCSVEGSKFWFNCNPEHPYHWFYGEWIQKVKEKNALYLHFVMEDNPALSKTVIARYKTLYSGSFYERFVLGRWVAPQGLVYPMFSEEVHVTEDIPPCEQFYISCDYGTVNPTSMGLWGYGNGCWYRIKEYYHSSKLTGQFKTDEEYYQALTALADGVEITAVIVDPSAASFIECIRRHENYPVIQAKNEVAKGIRMVIDALKNKQILFSPACKDSLREFSLYVWDTHAAKDVPVKEHDHAMDDIRYFVMTVLAEKTCDFFALCAQRD